mmetsp:Transcript_7245/g.26647  ORF Transcript_7245/g.26647 Transcript_7245/m.26647 type:complete len:302 (+) Transcript_7245:755-1660(+)
MLIDFTNLRSEMYTGGSQLSCSQILRSQMRSTTLSGTATEEASTDAERISFDEIKDSLASSNARSSRGFRASKSFNAAGDTWSTIFLNKKRSYRASSSSLSGSSLLAPTIHVKGTLTLSLPLSKRPSFRIVSSELRMAEFALKISSTNATSAVGRYPSMARMYSSCSRPFNDKGPKSSSGTEKRVRSRSKYRPLHSRLRRRPNSDFAVPGGPSSSKCSPQKAASSISLTSVPRSINPLSSKESASATLSASCVLGVLPFPFTCTPCRARSSSILMSISWPTASMSSESLASFSRSCTFHAS